MTAHTGESVGTTPVVVEAFTDYVEPHLATLAAFYRKRPGLCLARRFIDSGLWLCLLPADHKGDHA